MDLNCSHAFSWEFLPVASIGLGLLRVFHIELAKNYDSRPIGTNQHSRVTLSNIILIRSIQPGNRETSFSSRKTLVRVMPFCVRN